MELISGCNLALSIRQRLKVGEPVLRVPFAETLPALHRIRVPMLFAKMSSGRNVDALQGRITANGTGRT